MAASTNDIERLALFIGNDSLSGYQELAGSSDLVGAGKSKQWQILREEGLLEDEPSVATTKNTLPGRVSAAQQAIAMPPSAPGKTAILYHYPLIREAKSHEPMPSTHDRISHEPLAMIFARLANAQVEQLQPATATPIQDVFKRLLRS
jgi:hypothetical protein